MSGNFEEKNGATKNVESKMKRLNHSLQKKSVTLKKYITFNGSPTSYFRPEIDLFSRYEKKLKFVTMKGLGSQFSQTFFSKFCPFKFIKDYYKTLEEHILCSEII